MRATEEAPTAAERKAEALPRAVSVVMPAYNEEGGIGPVLDSLKQALTGGAWAFEIIVVDDGSSDRTGQIARGAGVTVVTHAANRGYGASLKSGIRAAASPFILIIDADGTYPSDAIHRLLELARDHDMVVGSRTGKSVHIPLVRRPAKWFLRRLASYLSSTEIPDLNSGLRVFRRDRSLRFFPILPAGFSFTTTITLALLCNDFRVAFVPIDYSKRHGRSKIRPIRDTLNFLVLILRAILYFNPLRIFIPACLPILAAFAVSAGWDVFVREDLTEKTLILLFAGLQILAIGVLADMISKGLRGPDPSA
ncbi:MAG TPA: glycosyltransferase family 2 protein [Verrucomicrobiae bacterium]|nr:glycosyltransferase family 2 protein [Verrucomicrobiae bacterium]